MKITRLKYNERTVGYRISSLLEDTTIDFAIDVLDKFLIDTLEQRADNTLELELIEGLLVTAHEKTSTTVVKEFKDEAHYFKALYTLLGTPTLTGNTYYAKNGLFFVIKSMYTSDTHNITEVTVDLVLTKEETFDKLLAKGYLAKEDRPSSYPHILLCSYPVSKLTYLFETFAIALLPNYFIYSGDKYERELATYPLTFEGNEINSLEEIHALLQKNLTVKIEDRYYEEEGVTLNLSTIVDLVVQ